MNKTKKRCIFCGEAGGSREDAFPIWLSKATGFKGSPSIPFVYNEENEFEVKGSWRDSGKLITKSICHSCNTGWMSQLEGKISPLLKPLVGPNATRPSAADLYELGQLPDFQKWILKTALTLDQQVPTGKERKLPLEAPSWVYEDALPPSIHGYLSWIEEPNFVYLTMGGQPGIHQNALLPAIGHEESFSSVFQFNHLSIRLSNLPGAEWITPEVMAMTLEDYREPIHFGTESVPPECTESPTHENIEHFFLAGCHWIPETCDESLLSDILTELPPEIAQTYRLQNFGQPSDSIQSLPKLEGFGKKVPKTN